jgi:ubiquinone/menaquinone biosynthesis C-methylase UbiE
MRIKLDLFKQRSIIRGLKPSYGYYAFKYYMLMFCCLVFIGFALTSLGMQFNRKLFVYVGIGLVAYAVLTTLGWSFARYIIPGNRIEIARNVVASLNLSGHEIVLDVGSGRGLYAIEAAKALSIGKVIAIDIWEPGNTLDFKNPYKLTQPTGNTISNARKNARIERVEEKIEFLNMDANHTQFDSNFFDLVICAFVVGHQRENALNMLKEMNRILKPGGRLILIDNARDFTYFMLSTPHLFIYSYLRGTKAKQLTKKNWISRLEKARFQINRMKARRGIITVESTAT